MPIKYDDVIANIDNSKRDAKGNIIVCLQDDGTMEYVENIENVKVKLNSNNTIILHRNNYKNCSITLGSDNIIFIDFYRRKEEEL